MRLFSAITSTLVLYPLTSVVIGERVTGNTNFAFRKGSKGRLLESGSPSGSKGKKDSSKQHGQKSGKAGKKGRGKKEGQTLGKGRKKGSIITTDHDAVSPGPTMIVTNETSASTTPSTVYPSPRPIEPESMPSSPAPVVPETPASVVPATPPPALPVTPAPVVPATPVPVVPVTHAPAVPTTPVPVAPTPAPVLHPATATSPTISPTCMECDDINLTNGGGDGNDQGGDNARPSAYRDTGGTAADKIEVLSQEISSVNTDGESSVATYTANIADPSVWDLVSTDQMKDDFSKASSAFIFYTNLTVIILTLVCSIKLSTG